MEKIGVLLSNIGTPQSYETKSVKSYLNEFLMDPYVINLPVFIRFFLVNFIIVPLRSVKSAKNYKKIWTTLGSPLLTNSIELKKKLELSLGSSFNVQIAMRYGFPSFKEVLKEFCNNRISSLVFVPLFPQYAESTTRSGIEFLKKNLKDFNNLKNINLIIINDFYKNKFFLNAYNKFLNKNMPLVEEFDHIVFSFHGLPKSHIKKMNPSDRRCLKSNCCDRDYIDGKCYRYQCFNTAKRLASFIGISSDNYTVSFQSRLGFNWIGPSTQDTLKNLAIDKKRVVIMCPSFISDCLETLEEIGIGMKDFFIKSGGKSFNLIPSLNYSNEWVRGLSEMIKESLRFKKS